MTTMPKLDVDLLEVLPLAGLDADAVALMTGCRSAAEGLACLESAKALQAAVRLCAFALPRREAVWWASQCATHTATAQLPAPARAAQQAAEAWVRRPDDANRRAAMAVAQAAGLTSPEAWTAVAAFWTGGSMAPPDQPAIAPAPHLAGTAVAGAVSLAASRDRPERQPARLQQFLLSARDIAANGAGVIGTEPP